MAMIECAAGTKLHEVGQKVETVEIILKGSIRMNVGEDGVELKQGSIVGLTESPGGNFAFSYEASTDATVYSYPFTCHEDLEKILYVNQKIAPSITVQSIRNAVDFYNLYFHLKQKVEDNYKWVLEKKKNYPELCLETGTQQEEYPELEELTAPPTPTSVEHWNVEYMNMVHDYEDRFLSQVYTLGSAMCAGMVFSAGSFMDNIEEAVQEELAYQEEFVRLTNRFRIAIQNLEAKKKGVATGGNSNVDVPVMKDILEQIIIYPTQGTFSDEDAALLRQLMKQYASVKERGETSDEMRGLRRKITDVFYRLYEAVFLKAITDANMPSIIRMFLMFGVLDERVVKEEDLQVLFRYASAYMPDPNGKIMTVYEWLGKIYRMEENPSRNEFDLDYPSQLREDVRNGDITEAQEQQMLNDPKCRLQFELRNFFAIGNRMTFGRVSAFIPVFDACNCLVPLDKAYASIHRVQEEMDRIRSIDYNIFEREYTYHNADVGIPQLPVHKEVFPYIILMPNFGSRAVLWQEIEGKKRTSPGRMMVPIFDVEDLGDSVTKMCGEFRWEMCKTEQGIHWNDLSDPSLTAEYSDYLQYYRKNSNLSQDQREKLKKDLQKAGNNYRRVFVADYYTYINFEAKGALRMNKVSRDIIFHYCPFADEVRKALAANPTYQEHINKHQGRVSQKARPLANIIKKMQNTQVPVPKELMREYELLQK
ncbi:MAG: hypothetical protein II571_04155 [Lachnospiraceae bacterium]|nr:hypothetical protein [Lachnospiraceae bacterium]MBQ2316944.1 hypothetical protein [Lachnospiraceae bacterium]MBQ2504707.1 hypothetical protein [Lachnospiraceae bacterium]MBQ2578598.1 hypothetical protein [Lachnospiraceae bacterium]MBQ5386129.1 hypothetical protein [Lachnospiraceae bacterium]